MATRCFMCSKGSDNGNNVSHAKNRTKRLRKANLHRANLTINGIRKGVMLCTRCLRMVKRPSAIA